MSCLWPKSMTKAASAALERLVQRLRMLEEDHTPDGYPEVQMRDISCVLNALEFYRGRCDLLQANQHRMRDPERTLVCDILANGALPPDPTGERHGGTIEFYYV